MKKDLIKQLLGEGDGQPGFDLPPEREGGEWLDELIAEVANLDSGLLAEFFDRFAAMLEATDSGEDLELAKKVRECSAVCNSHGEASPTAKDDGTEGMVAYTQRNRRKMKKTARQAEDEDFRERVGRGDPTSIAAAEN